MIAPWRTRRIRRKPLYQNKAVNIESMPPVLPTRPRHHPHAVSHSHPARACAIFLALTSSPANICRKYSPLLAAVIKRTYTPATTVSRVLWGSFTCETPTRGPGCIAGGRRNVPPSSGHPSRPLGERAVNLSSASHTYLLPHAVLQPGACYCARASVWPVEGGR